jgi:hypothetical protein
LNLWAAGVVDLDSKMLAQAEFQVAGPVQLEEAEKKGGGHRVADNVVVQPKNVGGQILHQKPSLTGREWDGAPLCTEVSTNETV